MDGFEHGTKVLNDQDAKKREITQRVFLSYGVDEPQTSNRRAYRFGALKQPNHNRFETGNEDKEQSQKKQLMFTLKP